MMLYIIKYIESLYKYKAREKRRFALTTRNLICNSINYIIRQLFRLFTKGFIKFDIKSLKITIN